jgi:hypothetical protein
MDVTGRRVRRRWVLAWNRLVAQAGGRFTALAFAPDGSTLAAARQEVFFDPVEFVRWRTVRDVMLWSLDSSSSLSLR